MEEKTESTARWVIAGLVAGAIVIGVAIGAYELGYNRGEDHARAAPSSPSSTAQTTTHAAPPAGTTVAVTPALVARGKQLYTADTCSGCHSLTGAAGSGPTFKGLAGSTVQLDDGQSVRADDAYLARSITDADAQIVKGFHAGLMSAAVSSYGFASKPDDVRALVAFIKAQT